LSVKVALLHQAAVRPLCFGHLYDSIGRPGTGFFVAVQNLGQR
jgi:hypothetical protein